MKIKNSIQKLSFIFVALSSVAIGGCSTSDLTNIVSSGNAMSTATKKVSPTNPNKVRLFYATNKNPGHYKIVGRVSAENYNIAGLEHSQSSIADELKKQAASIGANGVININAGMSQTIGDAVIIK